MGVFYDDLNDLVVQLKDKELLKRIELNVRKKRLEFTFDYHIPYIIDFFRKVINQHK